MNPAKMVTIIRKGKAKVVDQQVVRWTAARKKIRKAERKTDKVVAAFITENRGLWEDLDESK